MPQTNKQYTIADIQDLLIEINNIYYPCLKSTGGGMCYENCDCCKYSICCVVEDSIGKKYHDLYWDRPQYIHAPYISGCLYRFTDIIENWDEKNDKVINIVYDSEYKILELSVIKGGVEITRKYAPTKRVGRSLLELLRTSDSKAIGAINIKTGTRVKVINSDYFKRNKVYQMHGYLGHKYDSDYSSQWREIFRWDKAEWIM